MTLNYQIRRLYLLDPAKVWDIKECVIAIQLAHWDYRLSTEANLRNIPDAQSIKRARRHLHQFGYIEYPKEVEEKTMKQYQSHKTNYVTAPDDFRKGAYDG